MINSIRQKTVVGKGGKIEFSSPELLSGMRVEVIVLVEPDEQDATDYLLSTEANRTHLLQAIRELDDSSRYIYADPAEL